MKLINSQFYGATVIKSYWNNQSHLNYSHVQLKRPVRSAGDQPDWIGQVKQICLSHYSALTTKLLFFLDFANPHFLTWTSENCKIKSMLHLKKPIGPHLIQMKCLIQSNPKLLWCHFIMHRSTSQWYIKSKSFQVRVESRVLGQKTR